MCRIQRAAIPGLFILIFLQAHSQDRIYLLTGTKQGKVTAVNENFITYLPTTEKVKTTNIPLRDVFLLFNNKGGYLIPAKMNLKDDPSKRAVTTFLKQDSTYWTSDWVFETDKSVEEGLVLSAGNKEFEISTKGGIKKIPKNLVALIIYKNGNHSIQSTIDIASGILATRFGSYNGLQVFKNTGLPADTTAKETITTATLADSTNKPAVKLSVDNFLTADLKKEMELKTLDKTKRFGQYLEILCDKSKPLSELNSAIDLAVQLFVNESAIVETSSLNREQPESKPIRLYLNSLKQLKYDKIYLEWTNVQYADHLILAADGTYRGTVTFQQKFTGFRDNILVYQDITKKQTEVIVRSYKKVVEGEERMKWDIVLGDVGVKSTNKAVNP